MSSLQNHHDDAHSNHQLTKGHQPPFLTLFIKCPLVACCEFRLREADIERHLMKDHSIVYRCVAAKRCVLEEMSFQDRAGLERHLSLVHGDGELGHLYRCYLCDRECGQDHDKLARHMQNVHEEGHFACRLRPRCKFSAKYRQQVRQHYDQVHLHP